MSCAVNPVSPVVNGTAYCTINVFAKEKFESVIQFYSKILDLGRVSTEGDVTQSVLLSNEEMSLKIKLTIDDSKDKEFQGQRQGFLDNRKTADWRSMMGEYVTYTVSDFLVLENLLIEFGVPYQCKPNDISPSQIYSLDPQGNLVGFASTKNSISTILPKPTAVSSALSSKTISRVHSSTDLGYAVETGLNYPSLPIINLTRPQRKRSIAVMTSGGDAQGMNSVVRAVVRTAIFKNCQPFAIMEGYEGLVRGGPDYITPLKWEDVSGWNAIGGTNIGTARCMKFKEREGRLLGCFHLIQAGIDALIVCGGDGSLTGADLFRAEWPSLVSELLKTKKITQEEAQTYESLNICGVVGSIDNDMCSTDATIGAYSALSRICEAVDYVEATAASHSRAFVIEVMGRHCGWLALMAGISTSADFIFIPEEAVNPGTWRDEMCETISRHRKRNKRTTIVIVAEGALDRDLNPVTANDIYKTLVDRLKLDTRITTLGHVQRGGSAVAYDRVLATLQGVEAVNAVLDSVAGSASPIITVSENKIMRKSLVDSVKLTKSVASAIAAKDFGKVLSLRDPEFIEHYQNYLAINAADHYDPQLTADKRLKIAIVNVGAPAGGINSAVYSMATFCLSQGHKPYAIFNGWSGLTRHEGVRSLDWDMILGWQTRGGSELGTNRDTPCSTDIGMIAYYFQKYQFDGLIIVGGFEGLISLHELERSRDVYPGFRIPMVLIPATLSNNVPGTEYSLGSDTALNSLTSYCDILKWSASSIRGRVFVVDCQGGNSGYLATVADLAVGAHASYVPEEGISIDQLMQDVSNIAEAYERMDECGTETKETGKLVLKTTNASKAIDVEKLSQIMTSEAGGKFDARSAVPGHIQQGGNPSPIDRTRATRFAIRAVQFIEDNQMVVNKYRHANEVYDDAFDKVMRSTAAVLGVKGSGIVFSSVRKVYDDETDVKKRMPKVVHWQSLRSVADHLSGRKRVVET
ncbi:ATP-dependent 6-phosphofructokinase subunit beta [Monosporozyma unispora]|nr:phosphofructokinase beta-subunit [Kazachstania unispora]